MFSIKFVGVCSLILGLYIIWKDVWRLVANKGLSVPSLVCQSIVRLLVISAVGFVFYLSTFYIHLAILNKAGPHDSVMTSAFQASLEVCVNCLVFLLVIF
jgi:dolichyl-phosphate-mannose-protein mannosyltransferase